MTRFAWILVALAALELARPHTSASSNDGARIATALEQIAREIPRIRQAVEKQAQQCAR